MEETYRMYASEYVSKYKYLKNLEEKRELIYSKPWEF